jgi:hypothetical protein
MRSASTRFKFKETGCNSGLFALWKPFTLSAPVRSVLKPLPIEAGIWPA